jgi:hypothetical protein
VQNTAPIGKGAGGIEEIAPDGEGGRGTQRNAEEGVSSSRNQFSSEEAVKELLEERNSLRNQGDSSARMRNSSAPQGTPSDSSKTPLGKTEEALRAFAEEMRQLRTTMQFAKDAPREDRPAVNELMDKELMSLSPSHRAQIPYPRLTLRPYPRIP